MNEWEWQLLEAKNALDHLEISGIEVRTGSRVRLRPRKGGDVMDIALAGQIATVECIEQDYEGKNHVCVVLDNDPGKDMGCFASQAIVSSSTPRRSRRFRRKTLGNIRRYRSPASLWLALETFFWATMGLEWRWFAVLPASICQRAFA